MGVMDCACTKMVKIWEGDNCNREYCSDCNREEYCCKECNSTQKKPIHKIEDPIWLAKFNDQLQDCCYDIPDALHSDILHALKVGGFYQGNNSFEIFHAFLSQHTYHELPEELFTVLKEILPL